MVLSRALRYTTKPVLRRASAQSWPGAAAAFGGSQKRFLSELKKDYDSHVQERADMGLVPKSLSPEWTSQVCELLKDPPADEKEFLLDLLKFRVPPGVDESSYVKAAFLAAIVKGEAVSPMLSRESATELLGNMGGGYNVAPLVEALDDTDPAVASVAAKALSNTILMFDAKFDVHEKMNAGNMYAEQVMKSWADAEWFTSKPKVPEKYEMCVFKVTGETNTDDLSPAPDAWSRPDIPLHALAMLKFPRDGIYDCQKQIVELKEKGFPITYVGDVVGTGSSRKSGVNSVLWMFGDENKNVPNKKFGGVCIGNKIAPIFFNTLEDAGALPIECDVTGMGMGEIIDIYPYEGVVKKHGTDEVLTTFELKSPVLYDSVQAGGRVPLIIGKQITSWARETLGLPVSTMFRSASGDVPEVAGFTLAQKMVAKACGIPGVLPGMYVEPKMTTVGSQDTTGPMTRDELKDLACLGFSADLVMQSFCHTAAYPKPVDVVMHHTLPDFIRDRAGVALRPGDGIIHSWLNRMLLPDTVGTGGDSHTRFPIGISFPAGSGAVAFAAATGVMPLDMPESVLVRFKGELEPGITLRDLVHAIPYRAIQEGDLTVPKKNKKNIFNGRVLEIEGLPTLRCEQAFELSDAAAERSAAACSIKLDVEPIAEYLSSNVVMLRWMIAEGYGDVRTLKRRIASMEAWLENPVLMERDEGAEFAKVYEIDLKDITEPILCCPNDPDDAKTLSEIGEVKIDEVFIGSCMTNIGHFRAAGEVLKDVKDTLPVRLWVAPPTKMDEDVLTKEGFYDIYKRVGVRTEMPGCSLCMGNQARVADEATVVSTSTRNFPNRLGKGANVYLSSAELAAMAALLGKLPTKEEYMTMYQALAKKKDQTYVYMNFHQAESYVEASKDITIDPDVQEATKKAYAAFIS